MVSGAEFDICGGHTSVGAGVQVVADLTLHAGGLVEVHAAADQGGFLEVDAAELGVQVEARLAHVSLGGRVVLEAVVDFAFGAGAGHEVVGPGRVVERVFDIIGEVERMRGDRKSGV